MQKIILKYIPEQNYYSIAENMLTKTIGLHYLTMALEPFQDTWIECEEDEIHNKVYIYSREEIKKQEYKEFATQQELMEYEAAFDAYRDRRWKEMPQIVITVTNWRELQSQWEIILIKKPAYIIFTCEKLASLDVVKMRDCDELSEQDIEYIQHEHEKYLKYQRAREKYVAHQSDYSPDLWRGPQDDEYEADIMKYYQE